MASLNPDNKQQPSIYTPSPIDLAIPRCENDFISAEQEDVSLTAIPNSGSWFQVGAAVGDVPQVLNLRANKRCFLQNSLAPAGGSVNEIKVTRGGVYRLTMSGNTNNPFSDAQGFDLGVGVNGALPSERLLNVLNDSPATTVLVNTAVIPTDTAIGNETFCGSVVLRLAAGSVLRSYVRLNQSATGVPGETVQLTNVDIVLARLGRDGQ